MLSFEANTKRGTLKNPPDSISQTRNTNQIQLYVPGRRSSTHEEQKHKKEKKKFMMHTQLEKTLKTKYDQIRAQVPRVILLQKRKIHKSELHQNLHLPRSINCTQKFIKKIKN